MGRGERLIKLGDSWFSPKNIEVLPRGMTDGGRALDGLGSPKAFQIQPNYKCHQFYPGSQTVGDKVHGQKGKSPDRQLRSLNVC